MYVGVDLVEWTLIRTMRSNTINQGDFGQWGDFGQFFNTSVLSLYKEFHDEVIMSLRLVTELHNIRNISSRNSL